MNRLLRHIASIVLLATYLPMAVLSSLHVHHDTVDSADDCGRCVGHYEEPHHHQSDCQYCHFLGQPYFGQHAEQKVVLFPTADIFATPNTSEVPVSHHGVAHLRAPPTA